MRLPTRQDVVENSDKVYCLGLNERGRIHVDFPRLLREMQNSNSPKNERCKNFLEEMQSIFPLLRL